jgi:hypothetical protein
MVVRETWEWEMRCGLGVRMEIVWIMNARRFIVRDSIEQINQQTSTRISPLLPLLFIQYLTLVGPWKG